MTDPLADLKGKHVVVNGVQLPDRKTLSILGGSVVATDDPSSDSTKVSIDGTSGDGGSILLDSGESVGIGTASPLANSLHVYGGTNPSVRLEEVDGSPSILTDVNDQTCQLNKTTASGSPTVDISANPADGSSDASIRFQRNCSTTGSSKVFFNLGNGSSDWNHVLYGQGGDSNLCYNNGSLYLGSSTNAANLYSWGNVRCGSTDGVYSLSVAPEPRTTVSVPNSSSTTVTVATTFGTYSRITFFVLVDDVCCDYWVFSKSPTGTAVVLDEKTIGSTLPSGVTFSAAGSGANVVLTITNNSGSAVDVRKSYSVMTEEA